MAWAPPCLHAYHISTVMLFSRAPVPSFLYISRFNILFHIHCIAPIFFLKRKRGKTRINIRMSCAGAVHDAVRSIWPCWRTEFRSIGVLTVYCCALLHGCVHID